MLSERERRTLQRIERQLVESDPDLARLFAGHVGAPASPSVPTFLLVAGLALLVLGSVAAAVPVAVVGMMLSISALLAAHTRSVGSRRPRTA